jgi:seryl-tRNA synthetase
VAKTTPTDLVLTPAACYPLYPLVASRGRIAASGLVFDVASDCFRHEPSQDIDRFQSFRMREFVCMGTPDQVVEFRQQWLARGPQLAELLGLPHTIEAASDPFFGRTGKLLAMSQIEQAAKFELLIPVRPGEPPTACMSFNYHRDHFGTKWGLRTEADEVAHTGCTAFGIDRLALALFATHGLDLATWPARTREALSF